MSFFHWVTSAFGISPSLVSFGNHPLQGPHSSPLAMFPFRAWLRCPHALLRWASILSSLSSLPSAPWLQCHRQVFAPDDFTGQNLRPMVETLSNLILKTEKQATLWQWLAQGHPTILGWLQSLVAINTALGSDSLGWNASPQLKTHIVLDK